MSRLNMPPTKIVDLRIKRDYSPRWTARQGLRELLQNFFDGLSSAHHVPASRIEYRVEDNGWRVKFIAVDAVTESKYGSIDFDTQRKRLVIINKNVSLSEDVLYIGATDKRQTRLIGGHGEGLKVGVLTLLRRGHMVTYFTNEQRWRFFFEREGGSQILFCEIGTWEYRDLTVVVESVTWETFKREDFLQLSADLWKVVEDSRCEQGYLLEYQRDASSKKKHVFLKGLFLCEHERTREALNLELCTVNRDRELLGHDSELSKSIGAIWSTALINEASYPMAERKYTKRLLSLSRRDMDCIETNSLEHLTREAAQALYQYIKESVAEDVFVYNKEHVVDKEKIRKTLRRFPYACSEVLYDALDKLPQVITVEEALERALDSSTAASNSVKDLPLARLITEYVRSVWYKELDISYRSGASVRMVVVENRRLLVNCSVVQPSFSLKQALRVVDETEHHLANAAYEKERPLLHIATKEFLLSAGFRRVVNAASGDMQSKELDTVVVKKVKRQRKRGDIGEYAESDDDDFRVLEDSAGEESEEVETEDEDEQDDDDVEPNDDAEPDSEDVAPAGREGEAAAPQWGQNREGGEQDMVEEDVIDAGGMPEEAEAPREKSAEACVPNVELSRDMPRSSMGAAKLTARKATVQKPKEDAVETDQQAQTGDARALHVQSAPSQAPCVQVAQPQLPPAQSTPAPTPPAQSASAPMPAAHAACAEEIQRTEAASPAKRRRIDGETQYQRLCLRLGGQEVEFVHTLPIKGEKDLVRWNGDDDIEEGRISTSMEMEVGSGFVLTRRGDGGMEYCLKVREEA